MNTYSLKTEDVDEVVVERIVHAWCPYFDALTDDAKEDLRADARTGLASLKPGDGLGSGLRVLYNYDEAVDVAAHDSAKRSAERMRERCAHKTWELVFRTCKATGLKDYQYESRKYTSSTKRSEKL